MRVCGLQLTNQATHYGKNATHPWYDIGWADIDQFRITNSGRIIMFEFKHADHAPINPNSYGVIQKVAERLNAALFLVEYSCEDSSPSIKCSGNMGNHGALSYVSALNLQAGLFVQGRRAFTREGLKRFVEAIR